MAKKTKEGDGYLSGRDELDEFVELLDGAELDRLDGDGQVVGLAGELGHQPVGRFVADEDDAALVEALQRPVQAARRRAKVDDHVHLALARVDGAVDEDALVQVLAPLDHVHPVHGRNVSFGLVPMNERAIRNSLAALLGQAEALVAQAGHGDVDAVLLIAEKVAGQTQRPQRQTARAHHQKVAHACPHWKRSNRTSKSANLLEDSNAKRRRDCSVASPSGPFFSRMFWTATSALRTVLRAARAPLGSIEATLSDMLSGILTKNWISGTLMYSAYLQQPHWHQDGGSMIKPSRADP